MFEKYRDIFLRSFSEYGHYLYNEIVHPAWSSYFYWLIGISLLIYLLEILLPWRKNQAVVRKDFWLDGFYMFFNFFLFSLIAYNAISNVFVQAFTDLLETLGIHHLVAIKLHSWPVWAQLLTLFILRDFIHYNIHRLVLHKIPFLWEFHKVHHSVLQLGFAAHLRFHWMETIIYRSLEYIPLGMIGFGIQDFFLVHIISLTIGHLNHSNFYLPLGPLKYIFNSPQMHIWHHAKGLPNPPGKNFGLSLSLWDYLFGTAYVPYEDGHIPLGFENVEKFPSGFLEQEVYPLIKK